MIYKFSYCFAKKNCLWIVLIRLSKSCDLSDCIIQLCVFVCFYYTDFKKFTRGWSDDREDVVFIFMYIYLNICIIFQIPKFYSLFVLFNFFFNFGYISVSQSLHRESNTTDPTYMCCFSINFSILKKFLILCWMHKLFDNKYSVPPNST